MDLARKTQQDVQGWRAQQQAGQQVQDPVNAAEASRSKPLMPEQTVIAGLTVLPTDRADDARPLPAMT